MSSSTAFRSILTSIPRSRNLILSPSITRSASRIIYPSTIRRIHDSVTTTTPNTTSPRHFLSIAELTPSELTHLLTLASHSKSRIKSRLPSPHSLYLAGQTVAIMFSKRSTRTRISTEGAVVHLGGHPMFLSHSDIQLGVNESLLDTSRVISSMASAMVARVGPHSEVVELSEHSSVPVINALSDAFHPLQAVADIFTIKEAFPNYKNQSQPLKVAWVGDANNVLYDLLLAAGKSGISVSVATPRSYPANETILELARTACDESGNGALISTTHIPEEAVKDADVIVTDTWVSMGQESEKNVRLDQFKGYQVTEELAKRGGAKKGWKFMHCLPRKKEEVNDEVFYGPRSLVWQEAENRLYAAVAALEMFVVNKGKVME